MKSDETFIEIFLDFLNDKSADARAAEARFQSHQYVRTQEERGFLFKRALDVDNYSSLRRDMEGLLNRLRRRNDARMKKKIVEKLNSLRLNVPLFDKESGSPLLDERGEQKAWPILGVASFDLLDGGSIEIGAEPVVTGMEFACWYALMLVSPRPEKVGRCNLQSCQNWFNKTLSKTVNYCSPKHQQDNEELNARIRSWNARHPREERKETNIARARKRRKETRLRERKL